VPSSPRKSDRGAAADGVLQHQLQLLLLPDRDNKHVLAQSTVTRLFTELFASGWRAHSSP
jgi:hypothetical protein